VAATPQASFARGPLILGAAGLLAFHLAWHFQGDETGYWLPGLGIGVTLVAWLGWRILPFLAADLLLVRFWTGTGREVPFVAGETALHILFIGLAWWLYHHVARGSPSLKDPGAATLFLVLVPGILGVAAAFLDGVQHAYWSDQTRILDITPKLLMARMAGILVVVPVLIITVAPILARFALIPADTASKFTPADADEESHSGDRIELLGLTFATSLLAVLLLWSDAIRNVILWGCCMILIVWSCIRQGVRGGTISASVTSLTMIVVSHIIHAEPSAIQGHLLAFTSTALLLGVSVAWIRANELRYRLVVNRVPFVLYSVRLSYGVQMQAEPPSADKPRRDSKPEFNGPGISQIANVVLVSPASKQVFNCEPDALVGPFSVWLDRIEPADQEIVIASLTQLCMQREPITCEYRLRGQPPASSPTPRTQQVEERWVRDTLTPHLNADGQLDGWEGLVEDITEQCALGQKVRRMTSMLQVLINNLPTGVYFVQGPAGYPLLVNARARNLLGQREDLSAGLSQLPKVYRLHRPDGSEYPWEELPVSKALLQGATCRATDIVVHHVDGRKVPLLTWAVPVDLHSTGKPDAAVWVLEDWSAMQHAERALRESELRLRAIIETMAEGVIVQDAHAQVLDANAAACAILGVSRDELLKRSGLAGGECLGDDGKPMPADALPDRMALAAHEPARNVVLGLPQPGGEVRWLLANSVPLPVGRGAGTQQKARVVTTFEDISAQRRAPESFVQARDKYQMLVETLPFMLLQCDRDFNVIYANPSVSHGAGYSSEEMLQPGFLHGIIHPDDRAAVSAAQAAVNGGESMRLELRLRAADMSYRSMLAMIHPHLVGGQVVGSTSLLVDVTMQRRLEAELQRAKHLELVGRLASGTVHDFNNLLTVIMGLAAISKGEIPAEHPAREYLNRIEEVGEQAGHLAGQLLTFSKQRPRKIKPIDLNAIVTQTLKLAKSVIPSDVALELDLDPTAPLIVGDEASFKQVVMNLCLNARDAMPGGGRLTVRTDQATRPKSASGDPNANGWVHFAVQDTGEGMPDNVRSRIFEPFFSTKEHGTGLGLAVVHQIVTEFGGCCEVWSAPKEGTRIDLWLRKAEPAGDNPN